MYRLIVLTSSFRTFSSSALSTLIFSICLGNSSSQNLSCIHLWKSLRFKWKEIELESMFCSFWVNSFRLVAVTPVYLPPSMQNWKPCSNGRLERISALWSPEEFCTISRPLHPEGCSLVIDLWLKQNNYMNDYANPPCGVNTFLACKSQYSLHRHGLPIYVSLQSCLGMIV